MAVAAGAATGALAASKAQGTSGSGQRVDMGLFN
jgi:hypothetical protein